MILEKNDDFELKCFFFEVKSYKNLVKIKSSTRISLRLKLLRQVEVAGPFCVDVVGGFVEVVSEDVAVDGDITFGDVVDLTIMHGLLSQSNTLEVVPFEFCSVSVVIFFSCSSEHTESNI